MAQSVFTRSERSGKEERRGLESSGMGRSGKIVSEKFLAGEIWVDRIIYKIK